MYRLTNGSLFVWASLDLLKIVILLFSIVPVKSLGYQMQLKIWQLAQLTLISFNTDTFWKQSNGAIISLLESAVGGGFECIF